MNFLFRAQTLRLAIFLGVSGLLGFGYYLQYAQGLEPCPLCITQRFFLAVAGVLGLIAWLHAPARIGRRAYAVVGAALALAGGYFSSRQLYLQSLPADQVPACGPSIDYVLDTFPLSEALQILLRGDGNCAEVSWQLLGLSIPAWTLIAFAGIACTWIVQGLSKTNN